MTDQEISKALALAIGWLESDMNLYMLDTVKVWDRRGWEAGWTVFDYRDWNVIGPIAAKFDAFPFETQSGWESWMTNTPMTDSDTPQRAIALAVIEGVKHDRS